MTRPMLPCLRVFSLASLLASCGAAAVCQTPAASEALPGTPIVSAVLVAPAPSPGNTSIADAAPAGGSSSSAATAETVSSLVATGAEPQPESLPNAPSAVNPRAVAPDSFAFDAPGQATPTVAPKLTKYIPSGWTAQTITAHDKVLLGLRDLYSPLNFIAMLASAGYEQATNGEPNYGTDRGAFGQRLGAAAIRESSQGFLTDSVFSPLFHEDPRYYIQGDGHSFFYRTAYAVTRPFITRTDSGNNTINAALLVGYAGSAAASYAYYPQINRNAHDTVSTFGASLGGAALGYFVSEFSDDALKAFHLRKK